MTMQQDLTNLHAYRHYYRLEFAADCHGDSKIVEFYGSSLTEALDFILSDPTERSANLLRDGEFVCSIGRDPVAT